MSKLLASGTLKSGVLSKLEEAKMRVKDLLKGISR